MGTEYFLRHPWIGLLSNAPVILGVTSMLLLLSPAFRRALDDHPVLLTGGLFAVTRLLFLAVIVGAFRHVSLDLSTYFEAQGRAVLNGELPYRDFASSYAPLFPFLMALPVLTPSPRLALFLFFIVCDLVALLALTAAARAGSPGDNDAGPTARRAAWLYAAAPVTWYFLVRYGQDEALAAAVVALAWWAHRKGHAGRCGAILGFGLAATKFTFGVFWPPFWTASPGRWRWTLGAVLVSVAAYGAALAAGLPIWRPLVGESAELGFGPSLWRLPVVFTPLTLGRWSGIVLAAGLLILWAWPGFSRSVRDLPTGLILTGALFLILSPKVMPMYITPFWPVMAGWLAARDDRRDLALAAVLNLLLGIWWYFDSGGLQGMYGPAVQALSAGITLAIPVILLVLMWRVLRAGGPQAA